MRCPPHQPARPRLPAAPLLPSPESERRDVAAEVKLVTPVKGDQRAEDCTESEGEVEKIEKIEEIKNVLTIPLTK